MTEFLKNTMEATYAVVSAPEAENFYLEHEVVQNVYNLSNQQVAATGHPGERQVVEMEKEDQKQSSVELQTGFRILKDLMADSHKNVNWPFMEPIDVSAPDLVADYHQKIEKPVWLKLMKEKFQKHEYTSITEFVSDFRLMLENCYRYNGPDHYVSKRGQKLETMLEQKLALLSRELRAKTSIAATSGHHEEDSSASTLGLRRRQKAVPRHDSTLLLNQLREEELQREREYRRQVLIDRKAEKEALALEIIEWEDRILFEGKYKEQMQCMWELPQIGLFLFLCQGSLNIGEIMQLELERCIMVPRESSTMHLIMTTLLSTPFQRQKIDRKTLMPYKVWNEKLRIKLQQWYKIYADSGCDAEKACIKLGFEPEFFTIVGQKNPMERKRFHEISFYRRVWIVKGLCDYCMQTQDYLRETVEIQPFQDQREYMLGTDDDGWRYLHFPQFCGADVRIYRQAPIKYPKIEIKPDDFDSKRKFPLKYKPPPAKKQKMVKKKKKEKKHTPPASPVARLRPAGLRQTLKTVIPLQHIDSSSSSTSEDESEYTAESQEEMADNVTDTNDETNEAATDVNDDDKDVKEESETDPAVSDDERKSADGRSSGSDATIPYCDNSCSDSVASSQSCSRASSPFSARESVNQDTRDSVSQDTMFAESSMENSPMIDEHMLRKLRKGPRLKDLPNSRAARNLNSFLFTEDSNSKSSDFGDNSNSGIPMFKGKLDLKDILLDENSSSSTVGDNSNSCDMRELFKNSSVNSEGLNAAIIENVHDDNKGGADSMESMDTSENDSPKIPESVKKTSSSNMEQIESETDTVSGGIETVEKTIEKGSEVERDPVHIGDGNENKENIERCDVSHEQLSLRNANGFISRSESLMQDRKIGNENTEEEITLTDKVSKSENEDIMEMSEGGIDKMMDLKLEIGSDVEKVDDNNIEETDTEMDFQKGKRELVEQIEGKQGDKTVNECDSETVFKSRTTEKNEGSSEMAIDNVPQNLHDKKKLSHNDFEESTASQLQHAQNSGHNISIKQEIEETIDHNGTMNIKTEKDMELNQDNVKHPTKESELKDSADMKDLSKVKSEMEDEESETYLKKEGDREFQVKEESIDTSEVKSEEKGEAVKEEKELKEEEEEEEVVMPDMETFKLIVDSVEGLRELTKQFEEPEPIVIKRGKKEVITKPPPRKRCVVLLHNRLSYLLKELEPWEAKLNQATKRARIKLRKEVEDYVEKEDEEPNAWDTDEETESGSEASENENEAEGEKRSKASSSPTKSLKGRNSECSTPVKFEDNSEDIDISQRGRLRKRRIIPNNIEDQNPVKKSKVSKSDSSHQPVLVQKPADASGKITIGYSELIRQLKAVSPSGLQGTNSPILLQTSQGGKLLVTSIVPTGPKPNTNAQTLTPVSKSSLTVSQAIPISVATASVLSTMKQSQHPTIQHLLAKPQSSEASSVKAASALLAASSGLRHILPQTTTVIQGVTPSVIMRPVMPAGNQQTTPVKTPIILKPNTTVTPQKLVLSYSLSSQKIPAGVAANSFPVISQQIPVPSLSAVTTIPSVSVSTRLMPLSGGSSQMVDSNAAASKGKVKYYAANASTLPINVVQQLLATRGAKLQTGPNQQSILFIPMESEGATRSVIPLSKVAAQSTVTSLVSQTVKPVQQIAATSDTLLVAPANAKIVVNPSVKSSVSAFVPSVNVSHTAGSQSVNSSYQVVITTQAANTISLPVSTTVSVLSLPSNISNSTSSARLSSNAAIVSSSPNVATASTLSLPITQMLQIQTEPAIGGSSLVLKSSDLFVASGAAGVIKTVYSSPPKYPTNETVRTLLFKRKSSAEEKDKGSLPSPEANVEKSIGDQKSLHGIHFQKISPKPPNLPTITVANPVALQQLSLQQVPLQQISPNQNVVLANTTASPLLTPALTVVNQVSPVNIQNTQQCVFTSISASKLNTLLLQTSAAGAKSIPSLIKLPSKAALDSAVKAVVTSVNITLPTVNIKVPSPTSLPSIAPRRNVTKTIQTMKSPIPVAPKVVTQSSRSAIGTAFSVANSNVLVTSSTLPLGSVAGQTGGLGSLTNLTNLIPAQQIQSPALPVVSIAGQPVSLAPNLLQAVRTQLGFTTSVSIAGKTMVTSAPVVSLAGQTSLQAANLLQSGQSAAGMVQNIDGKNVLTKMIPQTILTSQGLVQGFITPQGIVIPQTKKPQTGSQGVSHTGFQVISQTGTQSPSPVTHQIVSQSALKQEPGVIRQTGVIVSNTSQPLKTVSSVSRVLNFNSSIQSVSKPNLVPATVQYIKACSVNPSQANILHAAQPATPAAGDTQTRSSSAPLLMPVSQLKSPALVSATLPVTTPLISASLNSASLKSPQQQTGKFIFPPNLSGLSLSSTQASASPMLNTASGLPGSGLLVPGSGGLPVASPLLNQLGFPLLQSGMAVQSPGVLPQNLNLQTSLNPALQQLVNPVLLTPGMVSPQLLNQSQGLQLTNQNLQVVKGEQLSQNNLIQLSNQIAAQVPKVLTSSYETVSQPTGQVQVLGNTPGINSDVLKQINAAALVKQLASSQLQTKLNVVVSSSPDVKPVLLQQQLNTPSNLPAGLKVATPNVVQNLTVGKQFSQLQGPFKAEGSQGNVEVGRIIPGLGVALPQASSVINPQQGNGKPVVQRPPTPVSCTVTAAPKPQTALVSQLGTKTIAVNQITNKVVTPVCTNPTPVKQTEVPNRVIAINKKSNKLEEVFPENLPSAATPAAVAQGQNKSVVIRPLKSPETVQNVATGSQQKIMLFSIGGQLVTQQGVPVTLENGMLKLMPQAIVQIANQTLTPKQIQQTLAKISHATLPSISVTQQGNLNQTVNTSQATILQPSASAAEKNDTSSPIAPHTTQMASQPTQMASQSTQMTSLSTQVACQSEALSRDHTYETQIKVKTPQKSSESIMQPAKKRSGARIPLDEQLQDRMITVPNITTTGSNNVQFVLKPMVTSGYIVCPRMTAAASQSTDTEPKLGNATSAAAGVVQPAGAGVVQPAVAGVVQPAGAGVVQPAGGSKVNAPAGTDLRSLPIKTETKFNVNGERGNGNNEHSDNDDDDEEESQLVIDTKVMESNETGKNQSETRKTQSSYNNTEVFNVANSSRGSYIDKEAALNLLRLANQAVGSSDEADEREVNSAGDATNKLGR